MAHEYVFTEPIEGVHAGLPSSATRTTSSISRGVGGLCMGGYDDIRPHGRSMAFRPISRQLLAPDWRRFAEIMDGAVRCAAIGDAGITG